MTGRNFLKRYSILLALPVVVALSLVTLAGMKALAGADGNEFQTSHPVSGLYKATPGTLVDGDQDCLRLTSAGLLRVSVDANTAQGTDQEVVGNVAHDGVDSGNPVKVGGIGRAIWETAASTAGDRVNASFDLYGRMRVNPGYAAADAWSVVHTPAANNQATASKAAGSSSQRHVCTGFTWSLSSGAGAPTPELITVAIRDGATGAGTIVWQQTVSLPATAGSHAEFGQTGLWLVGTAATAMTIETDSSPGANVVASVSLSGVTIPN